MHEIIQEDLNEEVEASQHQSSETAEAMSLDKNVKSNKRINVSNKTSTQDIDLKTVSVESQK